jgi:hypothetical protein
MGTIGPRDLNGYLPLTWWMADPIRWHAWLAGFRAGRARGMTPVAPWPANLLHAQRLRDERERTPGLTPIQIRDQARKSWGWPCYPPIRDGQLDWATHTHTDECRRIARAG